MTSEELQRIEAHRKVQWLAYEKHLAEVEEIRALERACEEAVQHVLVMRAELLAARLDRRRAELAWKVLHLARGAELLDTFRGELRAIVRDLIDPLRIIREIRAKLRPLPCEAIDWAKFEAEFKRTYPEFHSNLVERYPDLTKMEMKVCTLLRVKLTSVDIATLVCLSERSVEGHRANARKKLGLAHGEDIIEVIAGI
jgi:DNA-binding CsgD family transcriptional regulator